MKRKLLTVSLTLIIIAFSLSMKTRGRDTQLEPITEVSAPVTEGLTETSSVVVEPDHMEKTITDSTQCAPEPQVDEAELEMLACVIYQEAGGDAASDETRYMVGDVVLNRVADDRFPNTIKEVLTQKRQYGQFCRTGIVWPQRSKNPGETQAVERAYQTAYNLLSDTYHSSLYGKGYIWQAEFRQGRDVVALDGLYFGK